jgi:hypothetical protein
LTNAGKYLRGVGGAGTEAGRFHRPHGLALDGRDCLYVADTKNFRIQKFALGLSKRRCKGRRGTF